MFLAVIEGLITISNLLFGLNEHYALETCSNKPSYHYYMRPLIHLSLLIAYRLNDSSRTNSDTSRKLGLVLYDFSTSTLPSGFSNNASQFPGNDRYTNPLDIRFK